MKSMLEKFTFAFYICLQRSVFCNDFVKSIEYIDGLKYPN